MSAHTLCFTSLPLSRVEKVIRTLLLTLKNLLTRPSMCDLVVEAGLLHPVQALEYETWRDLDLYEEVRAVAGKLAAEVSRHSSFDRYSRELLTGRLRWGYIHTEKFWKENVLNFEKDQYAAVKQLAALVQFPPDDPQTLAVACYDLGEFARLHPAGKVVASRFNVKAGVMALMSHPDRDVARHALLCVQKLMLNQWQAVKK